MADDVVGADRNKGGVSRRALIKRAAIAGGTALWAAPVVRIVIGGGPSDQPLGTARLASFEATCGDLLLQDPEYSANVCARNERGAERAFTSQAKTACKEKCAQLGPCAGTTCRPPKGNAGSPSIGTVSCEAHGTECPAPPYARNTQQFDCRAVVTCACVCA